MGISLDSQYPFIALNPVDQTEVHILSEQEEKKFLKNSVEVILKTFFIPKQRSTYEPLYLLLSFSDQALPYVESVIIGLIKQNTSIDYIKKLLLELFKPSLNASEALKSLSIIWLKCAVPSFLSDPEREIYVNTILKSLQKLDSLDHYTELACISFRDLLKQICIPGASNDRLVLIIIFEALLENYPNFQILDKNLLQPFQVEINQNSYSINQLRALYNLISGTKTV